MTHRQLSTLSPAIRKEFKNLITSNKKKDRTEKKQKAMIAKLKKQVKLQSQKMKKAKKTLRDM